MKPSTRVTRPIPVERDPRLVRPRAALAIALAPLFVAGVYVFAGVDGASVGDDCPRVGCPSRARCAVFGTTGTDYGVCR